MEDYELPVWPFLPNWRDGVVERLSWATAVMGSETGAEQRQGLRLSPRRELEATFNPVGSVRTYFDLFLSELGGQEMMIPLWHDKHRTTNEIVQGTDRIDCHTEYGEFVAGGMALLVGADPWSHQAVRIEAVDGAGLDLAAPVDSNWKAGVTILPMRRARIALDSGMQSLSSRVGESQMRFALNQANDLPDEGAWEGFTYDGLPVVTQETNWSEPVEFTFNRIVEQEDGGTGLTYIRDVAARAFRTKTHVWHLRGRVANWAWRQFLYRMAGRRTPVWMPTGNQDMTVAAAAAGSASSIVIDRIGLGYLGGTTPGRDRLFVRSAAGIQVRTITGLGASPGDGRERINLNAPLTWALPAGTKMQFMEIMRADGDEIQILHHTDVEGMSECSINFRSFSDTRDASGANITPIAAGYMNNWPCGTPDSPCSPAFNPWTLRIRIQFDAVAVEYCNVYQANTRQDWSGPNGRHLGINANIIASNLNDDTAYPAPDGGATLRVELDYDNPDGTDGGPIVGYRYPTMRGYEWFFFGPVSEVEEERRLDWWHQFGANGANGGGVMTITVTDTNNNTLAQKTAVYSSLWPYGYSVSY